MYDPSLSPLLSAPLFSSPAMLTFIFYLFFFSSFFIQLIDKIHAEENFEACASTKKKLVMYPIGQHNFFHAANHEAYEVEGVKYRSIYDEVVDVSNL